MVSGFFDVVSVFRSINFGAKKIMSSCKHSGKPRPFEDVFPVEHGDIPASYVSLPEGKSKDSLLWPSLNCRKYHFMVVADEAQF